jgi:hypothetical protein
MGLDGFAFVVSFKVSWRTQVVFIVLTFGLSANVPLAAADAAVAGSIVPRGALVHRRSRGSRRTCQVRRRNLLSTRDVLGHRGPGRFLGRGLERRGRAATALLAVLIGWIVVSQP